MIAVIDYGMGNLRSVQKGLERVGLDARITDSPAALGSASGIVLPGVGAFAAAMANLRKARLVEPLKKEISAGKPYLGICLGLQLLFTSGEEGEGAEGLDVFKGRVVRFGQGLKVPHMGWNQARIVKKEGVFEGVKDESFFYFVHSYHAVPEDEGIVAARTEYGAEFVSAVADGSVAAVQFHPEKSQKAGLALLEAFGRLCG
ncbi:MAG: imidazole glycerol phosphate synthase subunit HisH [bacterium]